MPAPTFTKTETESSRPVFLRRQEVERICGIGTTTLYKLVGEGEMPKPIPLGGRRVAWLSTEIDAWMQSRIRARDEENSK